MDEKIDSKEQGMSPQMTEKATEREKAFFVLRFYAEEY